MLSIPYKAHSSIVFPIRTKVVKLVPAQQMQGFQKYDLRKHLNVLSRAKGPVIESRHLMACFMNLQFSLGMG